MGGVLSAGSILFDNQHRGENEVSWALLRTSIVGGVTLCFINIVSAQRCADRGNELLLQAKGITSNPSASSALTEQAHCLSGYCATDNLGWAAVAIVTAVLGCCASLLRSRLLGITVALLFAARAASCLLAILVAATDSEMASCAFWSLRTAYWLPAVTLTASVTFGLLALKFCQMIRVGGAGGRSMSEGGFRAVDLRELEIDLEVLEEMDREMEGGYSDVGYDMRRKDP